MRKGQRSMDKSYRRDNSVILIESSYWRQSLPPRCRLNTSRGCSSSQRFGCSPIKVLRELGSEPRERVRPLSSIKSIASQDHEYERILICEPMVLPMQIFGSSTTITKSECYAQMNNSWTLRKISTLSNTKWGFVLTSTEDFMLPTVR